MIRIMQRRANGAYINVESSSALNKLPDWLADPETMVWIDIEETASGKRSSETQRTLEHLLHDTFHFHPLAVEDLLTESHNPKLDDWDTYLYISLHAVRWDSSLQDVDTSEVNFFIGSNYLISYRDEPVPAIDRIWTTACREDRHTRRGADHLLHEICDGMATDYLPCMDAIDEEVDRIQGGMFERGEPRMVQSIFRLKSAVLNLRRVLSPQREVINKLARDEFPMIDARERVYFRDIYDHFVRLVDLNEGLRDLVAGSLDTYLSVTANRTNDVVKALTIFTVLFSPLTVITGFFGMNFFGSSIEIQSPMNPWLVFAAAVVLMVMVPVLLLLYIRRRGWW
jgi:magnesium transporter